MYKIRKQDLPVLLRTIAGISELILPVRQAGAVNFGLWSEESEADLETLKTVKSAKDAFFPQCETLYSCFREGRKIRVEQEALQKTPFVVFGMRSCDVRGMDVLDRVFLQEPVDTFYRARREHGTIVALACHEPEETCFCQVFGCDCADPAKEAADVAAWLFGEYLYWKPLTEKGLCLTEEVRRSAGAQKETKALLSGAQKETEALPSGAQKETGDLPSGTQKETEALFSAAGEEELETEKETIREIVNRLPYTGLSLDGWGRGKTPEKFNAPQWEELYRPCIACGTCTFVCPTCQCYDIRDYDTGHGVQRYRCWDSCMYSDFTMMAHGNNRTSQMQRFRQRFMHKLVYFPDNNDGMFSCVGCGRCVSKCPASLNIVKVIKKFAEAQPEEKSAEPESTEQGKREQESTEQEKREQESAERGKREQEKKERRNTETGNGGER